MDQTAVVMTVARALTDVGYVSVAGAVSFWAVVWPQGHRSRALSWLLDVGATALGLGTVAAAAIALWAGSTAAPGLTPLVGSAALIRLAVVAAVLSFRADFVRGPIIAGRRAVGVGVIVILSLTLIVPDTVADLDTLHQATLLLHLLAAAPLVVGVVILSVLAMIRPRQQHLDGMWRRAQPAALVCVGVLVVTGEVGVVAGSSGLRHAVGSLVGWLIIVKVILLVVMLVLSVIIRKRAATEAFRRRYLDQLADHLTGGQGESTDPPRSRRSRTIAILVGTQVVIAALIIGASALLPVVSS